MNRQAQAAVLFLVGGAVLHAGFTDLYLRYVKAGLRPLLLVVSIVLIVAAIATVWYEWRRPRATEENQPGREHHDRRGHAHREPRISWLLVLPLFALILVAPPALGSYSAMRTGTALQKPWGFSALPAGDPSRSASSTTPAERFTTTDAHSPIGRSRSLASSPSTATARPT